MKKLLFSSLILGLLTLCFVSCEGPSISSKKSATEPYFPEPCLSWGYYQPTVDKEMLSLGYDFMEGEDGEYLYCYKQYSVGLFFEPGLNYVAVWGLTPNEAQNIINNYKKSCTYVGKESDDGIEVLYEFEALITKDNQTLIYSIYVIGSNDSEGVIYYMPRNSEEAEDILSSFRE